MALATKIMFYIGFIHKDSDSDYGISFPDFPGCISAGKTFEDAMKMGKEALGFHAEMMVEMGQTIPKPSTLDSIKNDENGYWDAEDIASAEIVRVPLIMNVDRAKRINISMNPNLVSAIDQAAKEQGMTRSAFLASAALQHLG